MARQVLTVSEIIQGFAAGDRGTLARAITLVESSRPEDIQRREELLTAIAHLTGKSKRIGISGVPGVGKSTFIEALGLWLTESGKSIAVLAVDPSSTISGGSILGDKARMNALAQHPNAFIRPSPSASSLGGIATRTRESLLLCEAFGFDVVLVETVGVGQSETMVAEMVDFFLVLMLPGAGDELQGIKRGILELADLVCVNKADGKNLPLAREAQSEYGAALHYTRPHTEGWHAQAFLVSALKKTGLVEVWQEIEKHHSHLCNNKALIPLRKKQLRGWLWQELKALLLEDFKAHAHVQAALTAIEEEVQNGTISPATGAQTLIKAFHSPPS